MSRPWLGNDDKEPTNMDNKICGSDFRTAVGFPEVGFRSRNIGPR